MAGPPSHAIMLGRDGCHPTGQKALVPVLGACQGGLRIRLALAEAGSQQPFVVLHEGRFSRIYLAEITADSGPPISRFALKVQNDAYATRLSGHSRALTNVDADDLWDRENAGYDGVQSPHVLARVPVPAGMLDASPITYCRKVDRYFHPVCAETGEVLSVCRDDEFLASCGLLPYSQDTWRYLHGGGPGRVGRTFYRLAGANAERPRDGVSVRIGSQLFRDWARLVHAAPESAAARLAAPVLPCVQCEHRTTCHPSANATGHVPAEDHLRSVTFYDFRAIALELQDFDYDELCVLLGGGDGKDVVAASTGRQGIVQERLAQLSRGGQWLFSTDPVRFPREVLYQKLTAFLDVCDGLRAVHTALDRPHFAVSPANVMARLGNGGSGAPVRWGFRTTLIDLGSPLRFLPPGHAPHGNAPRDAVLAKLLEPGLELRLDLPMRPYLAADLQGQDGQNVAMAVTCRLSAGEGNTQRLVVEGQGAANLKQFRTGDVVSITPSAGGDALVLWAQVEEVRPRGFVAAARLDAGHPCLPWGGQKFDARLAFFRHFGAPVDLFGLGMLLFRTVLVNDQQSMDDVAEAVGKCLRRLEDEMSGVVDERQVHARLHQLFANKDHRALFDSAHVLQYRVVRDQYAELADRGGPPIDPGLWHAVLVMAFRLVTRWQGFSYCHSHADASPFLLKQVTADLDALRQRLHVDLFQAEEREAAIATVCNGLLEQLRTDMMAQPNLETTRAGHVEQAPAKGFRLVVEREGEQAAPQEYEFTREQVTIGRREVESLVRLNDPMVSSAHAVIELQPEGWVVIDRNSTNGTEVDGIRLPVDVPQPLQDGTVIVIRPFQLTFHLGSANLEATSMLRTISADKLLEQLHEEFARCAAAPQAQQHEALRKVLQEARAVIGSSELHARLEDVVRRCRSSGGVASAEAAQLQAKFFTSAHRSLSQLSRTLLGPGEFKTPEEIQAFAARLARFVETTSQWIERTLDLRRALGKHLELGATSTASGRGSARTAADVRQLALAWATASPSEPTGAFLTRFYDDLVAIIEGLLKGSQQVRRAVRERLDPQKLADLAGREAKFGLLVNAAANSTLWKLYTQTFQEVTEGKQFELELDRLLQKSLQDRAAGR